jgi:hypothetical protein
MLEVRARPRVRVNALGLYGALGLAISSVVHFGTYAGRGLGPEHPLFWALHVGIFPLFFAFVFRLRAWQSVRRGAFGLKRRQLRWRELLPYFPAWVPPLVVVLFAYVMANFFLSSGHLPSKGAGTPLADAQAVYMARAFSGHWLIFYTLPALFFLFVPSDARPAADASDAAA